MEIFRNGSLAYTLEIDEKTTITSRVMVENSLTLRVDTAAPVDFQIKDYTEVGGERYELYEIPSVKIMGGVYSYDALFVGNLHRLDGLLLEGGGADDFYYKSTFYDHCWFVIDAINAKEKGWSSSIINVDGVDQGIKEINYGSLSCLSALHAIATAYDVEFDVDIKHVTFSRKIQQSSNFEFEVGKGKGLYSIDRGKLSNQKISTRIYAYGGKQNMLNDLRLALDCEFLERNVELYGLREEKIVFDHIYPRCNNTITTDAVRVQEGKDTWRVIDSLLDFNLQDLIVEDTKIVFQSGDCSGNEFTVTSYDHISKSIYFKESVDESRGAEKYVLPNNDRYPRKGDRYLFTGIIMPDSYTVKAKAELLQAATEELARVSAPQHPYTIDIDPRYIKQLGKRPKKGDLIRITQLDVGLDAMIRVIGVEYPVINQNAIKLTVSDNLIMSSSAALLREIQKQINETAGLYHPLCGGKHLPMRSSMLDSIGAKIINLVAESLAATDGYVKHLKADDITAIDVTATNGAIEHITAKDIITDDITAKNGVIDDITTKRISTPDFMNDMLLGYGAALMEEKDSEGNGTGKWQFWADRGYFRDGIETLKLVYNQIDVVGGELWVTEGGEVETVSMERVRFVITENGQPVVDEELGALLAAGNAEQLERPLVSFTIKNPGKETNAENTNPFRVGDVVMGVIDFGMPEGEEVVDPDAGDTEVEDDGSEQGYQVVGRRCYMLIVATGNDNEYLAMPYDPQVLPFEGMVLARWGNDRDPARQGSVRIDGKGKRITITDGVTSPAIGESNIKGIFGRLEGIKHSVFGWLKGYGIMVMNGYFHGTFKLTRHNDDGSSTIVDIGETIDLQAKEIKLQGDEIKLQGDKISLKVGNDELKKIGIDIQGDTIILTSTRTRFKNQSGGTVALFTSTGLNADLIDAKKIKAENLVIGENSIFGTKQVRVNGELKTVGYLKTDMIEVEQLDTSRLNTQKLKAGSVDTRSNFTGEGVVMYRGVNYSLAIFDAYNRIRTMFNRIYPGLEFYNTSGAMAASISENGITMQRDATMNMPGVLCAGRVGKDGYKIGSWGAVPFWSAKYNNQVGYYKITHNLDHTDYFVTATPVSDGAWTKIHSAIVTKASNFVIIGMFDSGLEHTTKDYAFEFMIVGKNK